MTVESGSRTRSAGSAFKRSAGGAFTRLSGVYWYIDEIKFVDFSFEDFHTWTSTAHSSVSFTTSEDVVSFQLYDMDTRAYIGEITDTKSCTPKIMLSLGAPPLPVIINEYIPIKARAKKIGAASYLYPRLQSTFPITSYTPAAAYGSADELSTLFYGPPDGSGLPNMIKVGQFFYPAVVRATIDEDYDLDAWFNGKYSDFTIGITFNVTSRDFTAATYIYLGDTYEYYDQYEQGTAVYLRE